MEIKSVELKESTVDMDGRTIEGYASTWERDQTGDVIHKGAFAKSINERFRAGRIKVLWQHAEPIGVPLEMREDDYGLFVKSRISKTRLGEDRKSTRLNSSHVANSYAVCCSKNK